MLRQFGDEEEAAEGEGVEAGTGGAWPCSPAPVPALLDEERRRTAGERRTAGRTKDVRDGNF